MKLASETGRHRIKDDAWLSLVERCVRDAEAAGSNPVASTRKRIPSGILFSCRYDRLRQRPVGANASGAEGPARPVDGRLGPTEAERRTLVQIQSHRHEKGYRQVSFFRVAMTGLAAACRSDSIVETDV